MAEIIIDEHPDPIQPPQYICRPSSVSTAYVDYEFTSVDGTQCIYDMKYGVRNYSTDSLSALLEDIEVKIKEYPSSLSLYQAEYLLMMQQEVKLVMAERLIGLGKQPGSVRENAKHTFKG